MKYTLLELTQEILSSMDSDEVTSINDTTESYQVALLLKSVYYDCATELGLAEHESLFQLTESSDSDQPTVMIIPENVTHIEWIQYDKRDASDTTPYYVDTEYQKLDEFIRTQQSLREETTGVDVLTLTINGDDFEFMYQTDKHPEKYLYLPQEGLIVFDSYDSSIDFVRLSSSKTSCYGRLCPTFTLSDSFTPILDPTQFSFYKNRAKLRAFSELKQVDNREAAGETQRQKIALMRNRERVYRGKEIYKILARYGRK